MGLAASGDRCCSSLSARHRLSVYLYIIVPKGFFPQQDTGTLQGNIQSAPNTAFADCQRSPGPVHEESCRPIPRWKMSRAMPIGGTRGYGQFNVQLKPLAERKATADQIIARLRPKTAIAGSDAFPAIAARYSYRRPRQ